MSLLNQARVALEDTLRQINGTGIPGGVDSVKQYGENALGVVAAYGTMADVAQDIAITNDLELKEGAIHGPPRDNISLDAFAALKQLYGEEPLDFEGRFTLIGPEADKVVLETARGHATKQEQREILDNIHEEYGKPLFITLDNITYHSKTSTEEDPFGHKEPYRPSKHGIYTIKPLRTEANR